MDHSSQLKNYSVDALRARFRRDGLPAYRADQVAAWLYRRGHLGAVVRAHAVTNAAIFAAVLAAEAQGVDWSWLL